MSDLELEILNAEVEAEAIPLAAPAAVLDPEIRAKAEAAKDEANKAFKGEIPTFPRSCWRHCLACINPHPRQCLLFIQCLTHSLALANAVLLISKPTTVS